MQNWTFPNQELKYTILAQQQYRHRFTKEEDDAMLLLIDKYEDKNFINWNRVASKMPNRTPRQCRERYLNYLVEKTKKGDWSKEEDELIFTLYDKMGPKWAKMTQFFNERSNIDIKNRYSALQRRKANSFQSKVNNFKKYSPPIIYSYYGKIGDAPSDQFDNPMIINTNRFNNYYDSNLNLIPIGNNYMTPKFIF